MKTLFITIGSVAVFAMSIWDLKINDEEPYFYIDSVGGISESYFNSSIDEHRREYEFLRVRP